MSDIKQPQLNPLLLSGARMPGNTIQLPSHGIFYLNGELDDEVTNGEIHIHPMTAYDDILIKSPDLLLSGEAINLIITRCVPQVKKPDQLLSQDIDFILIALRVVSSGPDVTVTHNHNCSEKAKDREYTVNIGDYNQKTKTIDPSTAAKDYSCMIAGNTVRFTPIRYKQMVDALNMEYETAISMQDENTIPQYDLKFVELNHKRILHHISGLIQSVTSGDNTVTDKTFIEQWLASLSISDIKLVNKSIDRTTTWGTDMTYEVECLDCKETIKLMVPLNPMSFFI